MAFPHLSPTLKEEPGGVRVTQNGKSYLADKWKLREDVRAMIYLSISQCFNCLWVKNHPSDKKILAGTPTHYICFARSHTPPWDYLLAKENNGERITINKNHEARLLNAGIHFETQTGGGQHLTVMPTLPNLEKVIKAIK
ncbi:MAG: hypothetical protein ACPHO2_04425 [Candidatus Puniceispirillaceae bacterium]